MTVSQKCVTMRWEALLHSAKLNHLKKKFSDTEDSILSRRMHGNGKDREKKRIFSGVKGREVQALTHPPVAQRRLQAGSSKMFWGGSNKVFLQKGLREILLCTNT